MTWLFLANLSPRKVLAYKASEKAQERVNILLEENARIGLTADENAEMERYMTYRTFGKSKSNAKTQYVVMNVYISRAKLIIERANHRCEYCHVPEFLSSY